MNEPCKAQQRGSRAVCQGRLKGHKGAHNFVLPDGAPEPKVKLKRVPERTLRVARMLSALMNEEHDDAINPHPTRIEQARELIGGWESVSIVGPLWQFLRIKMGYCVRCPAHPCPVCGYDGEPIV